MREQRFDFPSQLPVACAGFFEKSGSPALVMLQCGEREPLDLLPSLGLHRRISLPSLWRSQALACFQSSVTVSLDILNTSAVSSTLRPPKKRSSTTRLILGSIPARLDSASSRATRSALLPRDTTRASSSDTRRV